MSAPTSPAPPQPHRPEGWRLVLLSQRRWRAVGAVFGCAGSAGAVPLSLPSQGPRQAGPLGSAVPCRVSLAPLPPGPIQCPWPGGEGETLPSADPPARWAGITQGQSGAPSCSSLHSHPKTYRDSEQGRVCHVLPLLLGMVAASSSSVSPFVIHRPPAAGELWGDRRCHTRPV